MRSLDSKIAHFLKRFIIVSVNLNLVWLVSVSGMANSFKSQNGSVRFVFKFKSWIRFGFGWNIVHQEGFVSVWYGSIFWIRFGSVRFGSGSVRFGFGLNVVHQEGFGSVWAPTHFLNTVWFGSVRVWFGVG